MREDRANQNACRPIGKSAARVWLPRPSDRESLRAPSPQQFLGLLEFLQSFSRSLLLPILANFDRDKYPNRPASPWSHILQWLPRRRRVRISPRMLSQCAVANGQETEANSYALLSSMSRSPPDRLLTIVTASTLAWLSS